MYRNICSYSRKGKEIIWLSTWDENGNRITEEHEIKPYLYYEDPNMKQPDAISMYNKPLRKFEFDNSFDRNAWIESTPNTQLFETLPSTKQFLLNKYCGKERDPNFVKYNLRTFFFDIEIEIENEFPSPDKANYPINVISIYDTLTKIIHVFAYKKDILNCITDNDIEKIKNEVNTDYESNVTIKIYRYNNEKDLLKSFLYFWQNNFPDIISGWNIDGFDIPYIIHRIENVLNTKKPEDKNYVNYANLLSPISWNKNAIKNHVDQKLKQQVDSYHIMGISICDYMNLYKKFINKSQQSWKLDYIAKQDLGKGKLDYYELGFDSMKDFMQKDFATFVKYNIIDSVLVKQIDDNRHFIKLMRRICNMGLCEYESIFKSIPYILGALCIEARQHGVKFLTNANRDKEHAFESNGFEGAFVFPTKQGFYQNGIMSFDFNSLYPNVIMSVNISPETIIGRIVEEEGDNVIIRLRDGKTYKKISKASLDALLDTKVCISATKTLFYKSTVKWGIVPSFLDKLYEGRKAIKKEMKQNKLLVKQLDDQIKELEKQLAECNE